MPRGNCRSSPAGPCPTGHGPATRAAGLAWAACLRQYAKPLARCLIELMLVERERHRRVRRVEGGAVHRLRRSRHRGEGEWGGGGRQHRPTGGARGLQGNRAILSLLSALPAPCPSAWLCISTWRRVSRLARSEVRPAIGLASMTDKVDNYSKLFEKIGFATRLTVADASRLTKNDPE